MSRYINADKFDERVRVAGGFADEELTDDFKDGVLTVLEMLKTQPTADVREVIRCKDCKYITEHYDTDGNAPYWTCSEWDSGTDYDGFCHYAERRGDE